MKRKILLIICIVVLVVISGCSFESESKELQQLREYYESVDLNEINNNTQLNEVYMKIDEMNGEDEKFNEMKKEILYELEDKAIDIWETAISNAIKNKNYFNYFDYRESLAYKNYYYWRLSTGMYFKKISPFKYDTNDGSFENEMGYVLADRDMCLERRPINNTWVGANVADKRFEEIYYLEVYRSDRWEWEDKSLADLEEGYIDMIKYNLSRINPNYDGVMNEEIKNRAIEVFGSIDEWEKQHSVAITKGRTPYFMKLEDIKKEWENRYTEEEIVKFKENEEKAYEESQYWKEYWNQVFEEREQLANSRPEVGMTDEQVLKSRWGKPNKINTTETAYGTHEQWCYPGNRYVYIEDGIVTSISY